MPLCLPPIADIRFALRASILSNEVYASESSFNICIGSRNVTTPSLTVFSETPNALQAFSYFVRLSSSIISPSSNSPDTCCRFINIALNARPATSPLSWVTAIIVPIAALISFTATPELAACDAVIFVAFASWVIEVAFLFAIKFCPSSTSFSLLASPFSLYAASVAIRY